MKLILHSGTSEARDLPLKQGHNTIGRDVVNDVVLQSSSISSSHCEITILGDSVLVTDLGSTNGSFINGVQIKKHVLRSGDILRLGDLEMRFEADVSTKAAPVSTKTPPSPAPATTLPELQPRSTGLVTLLKQKRFAIGATLLVPLLVVSLNLLASARNPVFEQKALELGSIKKFLDAPGPNGSGTRMFFLETTENGVGLFLRDINAGTSSLLDSVSEEIFSLKETHLLGWSPDDRLFAYCRKNAAGREIAICEGASGKVVARLKPGQAPRVSTWIAPEAFVYADRRGSLYLVQLKNGVWVNPKRLQTPARPANSSNAESVDQGGNDPDELPIKELIAYKPNAVAWQENGSIWSFDLASTTLSNLWSPGENTLLGFSYSAKNGKLLLHGRDDRGDFLSVAQPQQPLSKEEATNSFRIESKVLPNGPVFWFNNGAGYAYPIGAFGKNQDPTAFVVQATFGGALATQAWGLVKGYSLTERNIYVTGYPADGTNALVGIWSWELGKTSPVCVVPSSDLAFRHVQTRPSVTVTTTDIHGVHLRYALVTPANFSTGRKYPVVIGHAWGGYAQAVANSGAFFANIENDTDMLAARNHLITNPNVDANSIYLLGISAGTSVACVLLNDNPEFWKGAILLSPVAFPRPSQARPFRILLDYGEDDDYRRGEGEKYLTRFLDDAVRGGMSVSIETHGKSGHVYRSVSAERERMARIMAFISED